MMRLSTLLAVGLLALPLGARPAAAQAESVQADSLQENADEAERLAAEALSKLLRALDLMMDSVPQYAAPEVLPNGDIIIRRLHPEKEQPDGPEPDEPVETYAPDETET